MILIGTSNDYVIEGNDIDQSKLTYVSDTFTRLIVRNNFLNESDSEEHTSPTFDILYDEFRDDIEGKVNLPKDSNGNLGYGTDGQIGVSDGNGGIKWRDEVKTDAELSTESENPIQNKVVTKEINDLKKDIENKQEKGDYALKSDIPTVLPNPKSLKFTGAVKGTYDGSEEEVVNIPTVTIDSELSNTSENPIQNKVITTAINNAVSAISTNTSSIESHTQSIAALQSELDSSKLPEAINTALAQAKASGEFKGDKGDTPVKGTDYFTEADKQAFVTDVINALPTWQGGAY